VRLLFDQNISFRITKRLSDLFPDCKHVSDCGLKDCEDPKIWQYAKKNNFAIMTFDSDFYEISMINGHPPKIIWIRSGNLTTKEIAEMMIKNRNSIIAFLNNEEFNDIACIEIEI
jgi:predicted nuclease of predicted toxin-antitoxin system